MRCVAATLLLLRCRCVAVGDCGILWDAGRAAMEQLWESRPEGRLSSIKRVVALNAGVSPAAHKLLIAGGAGQAASSPGRVTLFSLW